MPRPTHRHVLVLGFGNPARGDDGAGPAVLRSLAQHRLPTAVELLETHQLLPEFAERFATASLVVLVDADARRPAGLISRFRVRPATTRDGGHRWTAATIAALAVEMSGHCAPIVAYTVGGGDFAATAPWELTLSPAVADAIERVAQRISRLLRRHLELS